MLHFTKCYQQNREGAIRIYDLNKGITTRPAYVAIIITFLDN